MNPLIKWYSLGNWEICHISQWWSHWLYWQKKNLPWKNKIFMMHLEQIPSCEFASAIFFECGAEWKRLELCAALSRDACRQMLAISKLQCGRWQCQLLNCGGVQTAGRKQSVWAAIGFRHVVLSFGGFLYWHLMAKWYKIFKISPNN